MSAPSGPATTVEVSQTIWQPAAGLLLGAADLAWTAAWVQFAAGANPVSWLRVAIGLSAAFFPAYFWNLLVERLRILPAVQRIGSVLLFAAGMAVQANPVLGESIGELLSRLARLNLLGLFLFAVNLLLWRRALSLSRSAVGPLLAWNWVRVGVLALALYLLVAGQLRPELLGFAPLLGFSLAALAGLVVARVSFISLYHGSQNSPFDRRWAAVILLVVVITSGSAALLGSLLTGQFSGLLGQVSSGLGWVVRALLYVAGLPFLLLAYLIEPLIARLRFGGGIQVEPTPEGNLPPPEIISGDQGAPVLTGPGINFVLPEWLVPAIIWLLVLAAALLLFRQARRQGGLRRRPQVETETLRLEGGFWGRVRERMQDAAGGLTRLRPGQRARAAARIRQIYAGLMDLSARLERPRPEAQTPLEFLPALVALFDSQERELRLITEAYLRVRYGELPETRKEIDAVETAWKQIQAAGRRRLEDGETPG